ncbi:sensor domain-containing diguanylate cyclase [Vreelandella neptunia]|uniref:diguanylate cyclase n=1 Tax=Vreelandella neptunia TaxID=115551 RepID=A0ABZ0YN09_9GAMM|nr:sensor domain-containing diguanylate cyclase [Halomonas neptunia]MDN3558539.1 sensor domain-containing diguanylate cyclase [Halomonas neptunia]TDV98461.1 PAS domain S-box-containing protein/diguanylate cyclase (GGDEF)-like protein [Halomonas alkaliantarctica]WQH13510.1 sensor domain-containing diguanylate cyclase [Halomonas neptunia]
MKEISPDQLYQLFNRSKRNTENVIKAAPIGICITTPSGHFEMVNPAYCEFYGYQPEELLGQHFTQVVPEESRAVLSALHEEFMQGNENQELRQEWDVVIKNGERRTVITEAARIEADDGEPRKVTFIIDITQRKRLEERLKQANERLDHLAHHDELTELLNRRAGLQRMDEEIKRFKRYGTPLSIAMYDLDDFKAFNDTYGHSAGDSVLQQITTLISEILRDTDSHIRLGGEEFLIIMPGVTAEEAYQGMERVRKSIAQKSFTEHQLTVTLSSGIASYAEGSGSRLLERADKAMYQAKQAGRNRVVIA